MVESGFSNKAACQYIMFCCTSRTLLDTAKGIHRLYEHACEDNVGKSLRPILNKL